MKAKLIWAASLCLGKYRMFTGMCPMCNSDAPELYDCPACNYYSCASGDEFPPTKATKAKWWGPYKQAVDAKLMVSNLVKISRDKQDT